MKIHIVGGGLAGSEAAWQCLRQGIPVTMYEMRPKRMTPAHKTGDLAELVCSNTFKSKSVDSAPGQLKQEMRQLDSMILKAADESTVPAGQALGVDRTIFSQTVTRFLKTHSHFELKNEEALQIPDEAELNKNQEAWIIATGPLSSDAIVGELKRLSGNDVRLFFYDAIAPIMSGDSIDLEHCFYSNRYDSTSDDYLNLPLDREQYESFITDILAAEKMPLHDFENTSYFEACLPIEVMAERGRETLRFGPMKPVGLTDPKTGKGAYAVIQLRRENSDGGMYSMVGFQTKMKWGEQDRIFKKIPALANAEFLRYGSVHRNTYLESPKVLNGDLSFKTSPSVFLAGQVTGVEGYTESAAMGLIAARAACAKLRGSTYAPPPKTSVIGALLDYVTVGVKGPFQPMNANFGLLPGITKQKGLSKADRKKMQCGRAQQAFGEYMASI